METVTYGAVAAAGGSRQQHLLNHSLRLRVDEWHWCRRGCRDKCMQARPLILQEEAAGVQGVEAIHVLAWVDVEQCRLSTQMRWQRQLEKDGVDLDVVVVGRQSPVKRNLLNGSGKMDETHFNAALRGGAPLVVDLADRIGTVTDEHHNQAWWSTED